MKSDLSLEKRVRVMQVVKFGLIAGVTGFAAFILFFNERPQLPNDLIVVWLLAAFGGFAILLRLFVPSLVERVLIKQAQLVQSFLASRGSTDSLHDQLHLAAIYQTKMIVGSAILEGAAFANLYACMATGHVVSWIMSGLLWLGLVIDFPTRLSVERWVESKLASIRDDRSLAGPPSDVR